MVMFTRRNESGAVSLFLVVFAMLLITIVTLGFLRIMLNDQQQASNNDLSKSAYDSSQAGVEDAKRALIYLRTVCSSGDPSAAATCAAVRTRMNSDTCNVGLSDVVAVVANQEVPVQQTQSTNDKSLNQAYTCVKIALQTPDYLGTIPANTSKLIPLTATGDFTTITVEWYSEEDLGAGTKIVNLLPDTTAETSQPLFKQANWVPTRPSLLRAQFMQVGSSFSLSDFDAAGSSVLNSNANTLFLYPSGRTGIARSVTDQRGFADEDIRQTPIGTPQATKCSGDLTGGGYACSVELTLPKAVGQSSDSRTAYLRLSALYNSTHFRVSLGQSAKFSDVQPSIDSTGRANDLYRRVESRVDLVDTNFPYPEAAVDLTGNFCKDFAVTTAASDFVNNCTP